MTVFWDRGMRKLVQFWDENKASGNVTVVRMNYILQDIQRWQLKMIDIRDGMTEEQLQTSKWDEVFADDHKAAQRAANEITQRLKERGYAQ